jgi:hypothetical protein
MGLSMVGVGEGLSQIVLFAIGVVGQDGEGAVEEVAFFFGAEDDAGVSVCGQQD